MAVTEGAAFALGAAVGAAEALSLGAGTGAAEALSLGAGLAFSELATALGDGLSGLASEAAVSAGSVVPTSAFAGGDALRPATAPITIATNTIAAPRSATRAFEDRPREEARSARAGEETDGRAETCATPVGPPTSEGGGSLSAGPEGRGGAEEEWDSGAEVTTAVIVSLEPEASGPRGLGSAAGR